MSVETVAGPLADGKLPRWLSRIRSAFMADSRILSDATGCSEVVLTLGSGMPFLCFLTVGSFFSAATAGSGVGAATV